MKIGTRRIGTRVAAVAGGLALVGAVMMPASAMADSGELQNQIDSFLLEYPDGVQISDNSVALDGGNAVLTFPDTGEAAAPEGLGDNVISAEEAEGEGVDPDILTTPAGTGYRHGCPYSTITDADWYCFYADADWLGKRYQFKDTSSDFASNWGFDNKTTSWVNNNANFKIYAYDGGCESSRLWTEPNGVSLSSNVGSTFNDRMSFWTKNNC